MPIYEYDCRDCRKSFEELVLSAGEVVACPVCDSKSVVRRLSVFSSPGDHAAEQATGSCGCTPQTCGCR